MTFRQEWRIPGTMITGELKGQIDRIWDARFTIPTPALLARVVDMLDHVPNDGPEKILDELAVLECEIQQRLERLRAMLKGQEMAS